MSANHPNPYGSTDLTSGKRTVLSCLHLHCVDVVSYPGEPIMVINP